MIFCFMYLYRKDATILNQELPGKTEYFISCQLTPIQYKVYLKLLELCKSCNTPILLSIMLFRCLCNHPAIFKEVRGGVKKRVIY